MGRFNDLSGQTFGRLKVICRDLEYVDSAGKHRFKYKCQCECGNITYQRPCNLKSGSSQSCGCLHKECASNQGIKNTRHGGSRRNVEYREKRLYHTYHGMRQRCDNPNNKSYKDYGGRGITVCEEWKDFGNFQKWALSNGYSDGKSIDRIDVNLGYYPENCRWADKITQANNTRSNRMIEIDGTTKSASDWARISGIRPSTILQRINLGWDYKDAVFLPLQRNNRYSIGDTSMTISEWSEISGVKYGTIWSRLKKGIPIENAILQVS